MDDAETNRFINLMRQIHDGNLQDLPRFISESVTEGLNILLLKLVRTGFLI
jgi:hypothetical protein